MSCEYIGNELPSDAQLVLKGSVSKSYKIQENVLPGELIDDALGPKDLYGKIQKVAPKKLPQINLGPIGGKAQKFGQLLLDYQAASLMGYTQIPGKDPGPAKTLQIIAAGIAADEFVTAKSREILAIGLLIEVETLAINLAAIAAAAGVVVSAPVLLGVAIIGSVGLAAAVYYGSEFLGDQAGTIAKEVANELIPNDSVSVYWSPSQNRFIQQWSSFDKNGTIDYGMMQAVGYTLQNSYGINNLSFFTGNETYHYIGGNAAKMLRGGGSSQSFAELNPNLQNRMSSDGSSFLLKQGDSIKIPNQASSSTSWQIDNDGCGTMKVDLPPLLPQGSNTAIKRTEARLVGSGKNVKGSVLTTKPPGNLPADNPARPPAEEGQPETEAEKAQKKDGKTSTSRSRTGGTNPGRYVPNQPSLGPDLMYLKPQDYAQDVGGIIRISTSTAAQIVGQNYIRMGPPLVLDLNGNGPETIAFSKSIATFDYYGNGFRGKTSWVSKNDALLAMDRNQDGIINDVNEIFGWESQTGFEELRELDTNGDNQVDLNDPGFALLRAWQDLNENGISEEGELKTLAEVGIDSISLRTKDEGYYTNGNLVSESSTYLKSDGSTANIYDVYFNVSTVSTQYSSPYELSLDLLNLPWIRGYGDLRDLLSVANSNAVLKELVQSLYANTNSLDIYNQIDNLISVWAGTTLVGEENPDVTDIGKIEFLEKIMGIQFAEDVGDSEYRDAINQSYLDVKNKIFTDFIAQTPIGRSLGIEYDFVLDEYILDADVFYDQFVQNISNTQSSYLNLIVASTLLLDEKLDMALLKNKADQYGIGEIVIDYLNNEMVFIDQNLDGSVTGDSQNNLIYTTHNEGVVLSGNEGDDFIVSGKGNDTLIGGTGNDTYVLDFQSGVDTIIDTAGQNKILLGAGISADNLVLAQDGNDLLLSVGDSQLARIEDYYTHSVLAAIHFTDGTFLEGSYIASMTSSIIGSLSSEVLVGGNFANSIVAGEGNDTLYAGAGNDTIDGGVGADSMLGGTGNDLFIVDDLGDSVNEYLYEGIDTVESSVSFSLSANVENLTLTGSSDLTATGNELDNVLTGNAGNSTLIGGLGNDSYVLEHINTVIVEDSESGIDIVQTDFSYTLGSNFENLALTGSSPLLGVGNAYDNVLTGNDAASTLGGGIGNDTYVIQNSATVVEEGSGEGIDTVETSVTYTLSDHVENLTLKGDNAVAGVGNNLANQLIGNNAASTLAGGAGNDTYIVTHNQTIISENSSEGIDTVESSVSYTLSANIENLTLIESEAAIGVGNSSNNQITGNSNANTLDGGSGTDTLVGGLGNDTYLLDVSTDTILEEADGGLDTVLTSATYTLDSNIENLTLTGSSDISGTGNDLDNVLTGNSGNNTLSGGQGNDTYIIQNTGDLVIEAANQGVDTVITSFNYSLTSNVENLEISDTAGSLSVQGNELDNTIKANDSAATLSGGLGNDLYLVKNASTIIIESDNQGTDTVQAEVSYTLASHIENLTLTSTAVTGTGNTLDNVITGNVLANTIDGGLGNDILIGGAGNDTYIVDSEKDTIQEYASEGIDSVFASVNYLLENYVENLTLTGASDITATGNGYHNTLIGNTGNNILKGLEGDDTLDGAVGVDTLIGGTGNDIYVVDNSGDILVENQDEGIDTVESSLNWTLANYFENLTLQGTSNLIAVGNDAANVLTSNAGNSTLVGGLGNDTYVLQNTATVINENANEGVDTVQAGFDYSLSTNLENLTLTGSTALLGQGNAGENTLTGNVGGSTLIGGLGNDTYVVNNASTTIYEYVNQGTDTVVTSVSYTLGAHLENLTLAGEDDLSGVGNSLNNTITGNIGDNTLDGGDGADTLIGGDGSDTYIVNDNGDIVTENPGEGVDIVQSSISYSLSTYVENLTLIGSAAINGAGNEYDNLLIGNTAANQLFGYAGNDVLDGGGGVDTLSGGAGNDVYIIDSTTDVIIENPSEGVDTVQSSVTYTLANYLENLALSGTSNLNGTGNAFNNIIVGNSGNNSLVGGLGDDTLDGGTGADTLVGGADNDTYIVDNTADIVTESANEGIDKVQASIDFTLGINVENLTLTGLSALQGTGNALDNVLTGNASSNSLFGAAGNDTLDGGAGADVLNGGLGDDTYVIDNTGDTVVENANEGTDTVKSAISYSLGSNVENLTLTTNLNLVGIGNALNNTLIGNVGSNILDGSLGDDTLLGGQGNDVYFVDSTSDVVYETENAGIDDIVASVNYSLGHDIENLTLTGSNDIKASGNELDNWLTGNEGNNLLQGFAGNDILDAGDGVNTLIGGTGNDLYVVKNAADIVIEEEAEGTDTVQSYVSYSLTAHVENLSLASAGLTGTGNDLDNQLESVTGNNTLMGGLGNDTYYLAALTDTIVEDADEGTDTVQVGFNYTLGANLENLTLMGGAGSLSATGNTANNVITGNSEANTLEGGAGIDTLVGGAGNDLYIIDSTTDTITETANAGVDTVQSSVSYTLGAQLENLTLTGSDDLTGTGNELDNVLFGNFGNNALAGGLGNDTYYIQNYGDVVTEAVDAGVDTVNVTFDYTLGANVENLVLNEDAGSIAGTGNALDNTITGNSYGNTMTGGLGNDTYIVQNSYSYVVEASGEGIDSVFASVDYDLDAHIENLTLTGTENISGSGNDEANRISGNSGHNSLFGGAGDDTLIGGLGNDTLVGGIGNDLYVIDSLTDVISESSGEGTDTVQSSVSYILGDNIENLILTGNADLNGTGNAAANVITGNSGANILDGQDGADTLIGGAGNDIYIVNNSGDVVTENSNEGIDSVQASVTYTLAANVENLILTGSGALSGTGNALDNTLTSNLAGSNTLAGGAGNDTYVLNSSSDVVNEASDAGIDTVQTGFDYTLSANVENLILTGNAAVNGTGNALDNQLVGNAFRNSLSGGIGNDTLDGGLGVDILVGGTGDDVYVVDNNSDVVIENSGEGIDTVQASATYELGANLENITLTGDSDISATGNALNNVLVGNTGDNILRAQDGDDTLDGGLGTNRLIGGDGNDTYILRSLTDVIVEEANEGLDTINTYVMTSMASNVENLTMMGTGALSAFGNDLNNLITGNAGHNVLDGGTGNDTLTGGAGNDTYIIDSLDDVIIENTNEGIDTVQSYHSYSLSNNFENLTLLGDSALVGVGTNADNQLLGNGQNNILIAGAGNDTLDGGAGNDTLIGGLGDDTYVIDSLTDVITESSGEGTDTVQSSLTFTLAANFENLLLTGATVIHGTGNTLDNYLTGNTAGNSLTGGAGNDTLDGGTGADTLIGGAGNDTYYVDNASDVVNETISGSAGVDSVFASVSYTLSTNVENLTLTGSESLIATGNTQANILTGNAAANTLDGSTGADTLIGGLGNDLYVVDNAGDVVTENSNEGVDIVQSSVTYTLSANIENLTLTGTSTVHATGNAQDNYLIGNTGANSLTGGAGLDTLDGGTGTDTLIGNLGNDVYVVDVATDVIIEKANEGWDTVLSTATYTLGSHIEELQLIGTASINATGNALDNKLVGNTAANTLDGGIGADTLMGGQGNDTYIIDNAGDTIIEKFNEGIDTVQSSITYTLGDMVENLTLTGSANLEGTGNSFNNVLTGNTGNNRLVGNSGSDTLDGGTGADTLVGGTGNDSYIIDNTGDVIEELDGEGIDSVQSSVTYTLAANVENLTLTGATAIHGIGNELDNALTGNTANNSLTGGAGNDTLDGGTGNDTLVGGTGDDTYVINVATDSITEFADEGIDTVQSAVTYTLSANLEHLTLTGASIIHGTGNAQDNYLTGNAAYNSLTGGDGNDTLDGGLGNDILVGGAGDDTYYVDSATDVVNETIAGSSGIDTVFASVSHTLATNVENLILTGTSNLNGMGNASNNVLVGNTGNNSLNGGTGNDTFQGGLGDDIYVVDSGQDVVIENGNEGVDTVQTAVSYTLSANVENLIITAATAVDGTGNELDNQLTGGSGNNQLTGGAGNDTLNGAAGVDTLIGGTGNDTYVVDTITDTLTELDGEGTDTVQSSVTYTLGSYVENLTLTTATAINGVGNTLDNRLTGGGGNNSLSGGAGNDTLEGAAGTDTLTGGTGDDTYIVDTTTDTITELTGEGTDTVQSSVTYTLGAYLENLVLTGSNAINGVGNALDNQMTGNSANNTLDGGAGADTLIGGAGNDLYLVDNSGDVITENANEGTDTVQSSVSYTLSANVENLTLTGSSNLNGTGNELDNRLTGNSGNNSLTGGAGNDTYVFTTGFGHDSIDDSAGNDTLDLSGLSSNLALDLTKTTLTVAVGSQQSLLQFGGSSGSNVIADAFGNSWTAYGNAQITTSNPWLSGEQSLALDGTGDYIRSTQTIPSGSNYTIRWRQRFDDFNQTQYMVSGSNAYSLALSTNGSFLKLQLSSTGTGWNILNFQVDNRNYVTDQWYEFEVSYSASSGYRVYVNGNITIQTGATTAIYSAGGLVLGAYADGQYASKGAIADAYFTNNAVLHTSNFTPLGSPYVVDTNTLTWNENSIENAISGSGNDALTGTAANNQLTGGAGNDTLDGGAGNDTLVGGLGNDTYIVDSSGDIITENASEGTDTVQASVSYTLAANVENLILQGSEHLRGTGNSSANSITGNAGQNTLDGGTGIDTLIGGTGDDTYIVDNASDVTTEAAGEGNDTVLSSVTYTLSSTQEVENLFLTGNTAINGTGNSLNNYLLGNTANNQLTGGAGNDTLDGGLGNDTLVGGAGDDMYYVDSATDVINETISGSAGVDSVFASVSYTLSTNVENLTLTGSGHLAGTGSASNNIITGNSGNNTLSGAAGVDTLIGGTGDDTYIVDTTTDTITELTGEGIDTVQSSVTYTLGSYVENLILTAATAIHGVGNTLDNRLIGGSGNNSLSGGAGNDTLEGGAGTDTLIGGTGDDTYVVDTTTDTITELTGEGTDTVQSSVTYTLGAYLENLILTATNAINGVGNTLDNQITGNAFNNTLDGAAGADTLVGGLGDDLYLVDDADDTIIEAINGGVDTIQSTISYTLMNNVENLTLAGSNNIAGIGNALDNVLTGNNGDNTLSGGLGNDTYVIQNYGDSVVENADEGIDTVNVTFDYTLGSNIENLILNAGAGSIQGTGNTLDNLITGNSGNNTLDGAAGNDTLDGGTGNDWLWGGIGDDTYTVDSTGDVVSEYADEGTDTIQSSVTYTLGSYLEHLTLTTATAINGVGNTLDNRLTGGGGNNSLSGGAGNDTLEGGAGTDTLIGGTGDDTYIVDTTTDTITELTGEGTDTVQSSVTYTLGAYLENLVLTGSNAINGVGNALDNQMTGNSANNTLDGGAGADTLIGGAGNDLYLVDNSGDVITENANEGTDTVQSSVSYTLSANVENLTLTGSSNLNGTGNELDNRLTGNSGNNSLTGGAGNDTYVFTTGFGHDTLNDASGTDTVDFSAIQEDLIVDLSAGTATADIYTSNQEALLQFEGSSGSNVIADAFGNSWTAYGNAQVTTNNPWLSGEQSVVLDGTGDYVRSTTVKPDGNQFAIHLKVRFDNPSSSVWQTVLGTNTNYSMGVYMNQGLLKFYASSNNTSWNIAGIAGTKTNWVAGQWYDLEVNYSNTTGYKVFVDGNLEISVANTTKIYAPNGLILGANYVGTEAFSGAIADVYFANNKVLHDTSFTPSSEPYSTGISTADWGAGTVENVIGGSGNDALTGTAANNQLTGGAGNDTLDGGGGNDVYLFEKGDGQDRIIDTDITAGNLDTIKLGSSITKANVILFQSGDDLQIGYTNSYGDVITIEDQFLNDNSIERIELSDGAYMTDADVNNIISQIASYAANNNISLTNLDDVKADSNLVAIVNGGWHS